MVVADAIRSARLSLSAATDTTCAPVHSPTPDQLAPANKSRGFAHSLGVFAATIGVAAALVGCDGGNVAPPAMAAGVAATTATAPSSPAGYADGDALAKQFTIPSPAEGARLYNKATIAAGNVDIMKHVVTKPFANDELVAMREVAVAAALLWRCSNARHIDLVRVSQILDGRTFNGNYSGIAYSTLGFVALSDGSRIEGHTAGTAGTFAHEVAHVFLEYANPLTCENYDRPEQNPLVQDYIKRAQAHGGKAITDYGMKSWIEDLAEAFRLYLTHRDDLRRDSGWRADFFDELYQKLGSKPPAEVSEYSTKTAYISRADMLWQLTLTNAEGRTVHVTLTRNFQLKVSVSSHM